MLFRSIDVRLEPRRLGKLEHAVNFGELESVCDVKFQIPVMGDVHLLSFKLNINFLVAWGIESPKDSA